jgi:hypothetical protein
MIFTAETYIELNNGKMGKRQGPIYIPDQDLPFIGIEPVFTTAKKNHCNKQCIITWNSNKYIINYNIHKLQDIVANSGKRLEIKGFK